MKNIIRRWLGIKDLNDRLDYLQHRIAEIKMQQESAQDQLGTIVPGMARVIAKLDPAYAQDPHSKETMAASDKIANEILSRLTGEHIARQKHPR